MSDQLVIVGAQLNFLVGDIEGNAKRIIEEAKFAYENYHADLVVFPELNLTGYPPEDLLFRSSLYQRIHVALQTLAESIKHTAILVGYPDQIDHHYYNQAALISEGKLAFVYSKRELPNYHVFDEKRYFSPGTQPGLITIKGVRFGIVVCEDLWLETPIQECMQRGAKCIISLNASPFAIDKTETRRKLLAKRSLEYKVPIIYVNLVGGQDELVFDGGSMVFGPDGKALQQAPYCQEARLVVTCHGEPNFSILSQNPLPKEPSSEEKIYQVLVLGVRDYVRKNNFTKACLGVSGGIDSALTLAIASDAIGPQNVEAILMPSRYTAQMSSEDAQTIANNLGVKTTIISIEAIFQTFLTSLSQEFSNFPMDITEQNIQARIRATLLMALSNKKGSIVLITGNKSEFAVGYTTLYGDMAGGFAVLKDVYKTMVYQLCRYRNSLSPVIPERVFTRPPSAELAENQTDQDDLPPYPILDAILERYISFDEDENTIIAAGFDSQTVKKVIHSVDRNEYKRHQAPVGTRISERAFGKDWRYPITSGFRKNKSP